MSDEKSYFNFFKLSKFRQKDGTYPSVHLLCLPTFLHSHTTFKPSDLLRENSYRAYRNAQIDEDEALNWSSDMIKLIHKKLNQQEKSSTLQTAVRRGVPDFLKRDVFMFAQNALSFKEQNPRYYGNQLHHTFGVNIPRQFHDRVPTFCGGFLGIEEEILNTPLDIDKLEVNFDFNVRRSEISWMDLQRVAGCGNDENDTFAFVASTNINGENLTINSKDHNGDLANHPYSESGSRIKLTRFIPFYSAQKNHIFNKKKLLRKNVSEFIKRQWLKRPTKNTSELLDLNNKCITQKYTDTASSDLKESHKVYDLSSEFRRPPGLMTESSREGGTHDVYRVECVTYLHECLSEHGLNAVKRLLWCFNSTFPELEFCPILPCLLCVALFYLSEPDAFYLVASLLNEARVRSAAVHEIPFLMYRRSEYIRFVKFVTEVAKKYMSKLIQYLNSLQMDVAAWIARSMAQDTFTDLRNIFLRINSIRLLCARQYSVEGYSVILRYCLAIFKINESKLLQCNTKEMAEKVLLSTKNIDNVEDVNNLTKIAFCMSIKWSKGGVARYTSHDLPTPFLVGVKLHRFYRPRLSELSHIITDVQWEYIWGWIPHTFRILDPYIAWRTSRHGMSLIALEKHLISKRNEPVLFFIRTKSREIMGGFFSEAVVFFPHHHKRIDNSNNFVFQLFPKPNAYYWTALHANAVWVTSEGLIIGVDDTAIYLDSSIHHGRSRPSLSFRSPQLAGNEHGDFIVDSMEVWTLH